MKYKFHRIKNICELITLICKILFYLSHTPSKYQKEVKIMGKDLKGNELGKGITQRKDGRYQARIYASKDSKTLCFYGFDLDELKKNETVSFNLGLNHTSFLILQLLLKNGLNNGWLHTKLGASKILL